MVMKAFGLVLLVLGPAAAAFLAGYTDVSQYFALGAVLAINLTVLARPIAPFAVLLPIAYAAAAVTSESTDGDLLQVDWIGSLGWTTGPDHIHPHQEERFEVLFGRLGLTADGVKHVHGPGEVVVVEAGIPHAAWNAGDADDGA